MVESSLVHRSSSPTLAIASPGDHIYVERDFYSHHGLYLGGDVVIDFASTDGQGKRTAAIRRTTLADFARGAAVRTVVYGDRLTAEESVARAESMLGRSGYDLFANNCEHFATWCVTGEHSSAQVEAVWCGASFVGSATVAPRLGIGLVAGAGETPAMSAPNLMSGLKTVGGGNALGGVGVLAGAGAILGAGSVCLAFRDKHCLPAKERSARSAGRVGAVSGGALGVGAVLYSVGALGVAGYSAAGLSSGLSALGSPIGGGIAAGVTVAIITPAICAALLALVYYCVARWLQGRSGAGPALSAI
jgi:Lecithin retinol acyltransferase